LEAKIKRVADAGYQWISKISKIIFLKHNETLIYKSNPKGHRLFSDSQLKCELRRWNSTNSADLALRRMVHVASPFCLVWAKIYPHLQSLHVRPQATEANDISWHLG
jgi:hypothetical protein